VSPSTLCIRKIHCSRRPVEERREIKLEADATDAAKAAMPEQNHFRFLPTRGINCRACCQDLGLPDIFTHTHTHAHNTHTHTHTHRERERERERER
jgi:hypothetical protein